MANNDKKNGFGNILGVLIQPKVLKNANTVLSLLSVLKSTRNLFRSKKDITAMNFTHFENSNGEIFSLHSNNYHIQFTEQGEIMFYRKVTKEQLSVREYLQLISKKK